MSIDMPLPTLVNESTKSSVTRRAFVVVMTYQRFRSFVTSMELLRNSRVQSPDTSVATLRKRFIGTLEVEGSANNYP